MDGKIHSSTASGYLILPKLHDSTYSFSVGFPHGKWPESNFSVAIAKKDQGYLLKNFKDQGWGLFNLQTLAVQMSATTAVKKEVVAAQDNQPVSPFTEILSKAADDPSLKEKPAPTKPEEKKPESSVQEVVKKEEPKVEGKETAPSSIAQAQPQIKKEETKVETKEPVVSSTIQTPVSVPVAKPEEPKAEAKESSVAVDPVKLSEPEYKKSSVTKKSESSTTEGFGLTFLDTRQDGKTDTIRVLIPEPKALVDAPKETPKEEKKFLDIASNPASPAKEEEKKAEVKPVVTETAPIGTSKSSCSATADENDFFKLRKLMAAAENDDDMLSEARKYFKTKCFTVAQIKNLSTLFLNDEGKYRFFDTAYLFTSDVTNFASMQAELKEEYYINRFRAMLRN
jgi:hypothetical protein